MKFLHSMVRISDIDESLKFYCQGLGLQEIRRKEVKNGRFTLIFLDTADKSGTELELTHNWDPESYDSGRNFGHLAFSVKNIYEFCQHLKDMGITINRPPRDGHMAFVRSPDGISIEILQDGASLPQAEPWASMENIGTW